MALRVPDVADVSPHASELTPPDPHDSAIVELRGSPMRALLLDEVPAEVETLVEMIRLRTAVVDRDRRIATLTIGVRTWRERAIAEAAARRTDLADAHDREREIVSLLHQQMQLADSATAELERVRSRPWWQRLRS